MTAAVQQQQSNRVAQVAAATTAAMATTAVVAAYINLVSRARQRVLAALAAQWSQLGSYRDADATKFLASALPLIQAGQQHASALTSGYLATVSGNLTGGSRAPVGVPMDSVTGTALRGVDPADVYMRPFQQVWYQLSLGKPLDDAVQAGAQRLQAVAGTDLQLATTHTARAVLDQSPHIVGYRRVLTGAENCGLCVIASTQRYHKADLLPIHNFCDCVVAPVVGANDPGQVINSSMLTTGHLPVGQNRQGVDIYSADHLLDVGDLLPAVHSAIKDAFGKSSADARTAIDYRHVITVHQHGEIGPVLTVKGQKFTGPSAIH